MLGGKSLSLIAVAVLISFASFVSGAESKQDSKNPSKPVSQDEVQTRSDLFSKRLFSDPNILGRNNFLLTEAKTTKFIHGIAAQILPANDYAAYMLQNFAFLSNAIKATKHAAEIMNLKGELEYAQSYRYQVRGYENKLGNTMARKLQMKDTDGVVLGRAVEEYAFFLEYVSGHNPEYLAIALLPRTMLWRWIADELYNLVRPQDTLYYGWIEENKSKFSGEQSALEKFVDKKFSTSDQYLKAVGIFCRALIYEVNFFREAGHESLVGVPTFCKI